jgi:hypothetical protein
MIPVFIICLIFIFIPIFFNNMVLPAQTNPEATYAIEKKRAQIVLTTSIISSLVIAITLFIAIAMQILK